MKPALVIGCGVSGLTCALGLQRAGYRVTILAREIPPNTTSDVPAAVWYPYRAFPQERVLAWAAAALRRFEQLAEVAESGVSFLELRELGRGPASDPWWRSAVRTFRRLTPAELHEPYRDGWAVRVPLIEMPVFLPYLMNQFREGGGTIETTEVRSIQDCIVRSRLVINCTGLGARELCADTKLIPIRGQVVRTSRGSIDHASVEHEETTGGVAYVIPRSGDCVLGSTAQENNWNLRVDENETRDIVRRCTVLEPRIGEVEILGARAGLRPGRSTVRLERERFGEAVVIHNYGHGGAGVTLSWGCAEEVVTLATTA